MMPDTFATDWGRYQVEESSSQRPFHTSVKFAGYEPSRSRGAC